MPASFEPVTLTWENISVYAEEKENKDADSKQDIRYKRILKTGGICFISNNVNHI